MSGQNFSEFFKDYVYTPNDFEIPLKESFDYLGIEFSKKENPNLSEHQFGFKTVDNGTFNRVALVAPYSPSWKAGLFAGDEIIAVNNMVLKNNLNHWLNYFLQKDEIILSVNSGEQLKNMILQKDKKGNTWFFQPALTLKENADAKTKEAFDAWKIF